jgi:DNA invertase Pin-like site-specific DNA recombinase
MPSRRRQQKVIGYLRVSTVDQDTGKNRAAILDYANKNNMGQVAFVEEQVSGATSWRKRKLRDVVEDLNEGDRLIVPELSRLGRSIAQVLEVLAILSDKQVAVFSVKEGFQLNGSDLQSKVMRTMFALLAEIERDLIVMRTREGLQARKAAGVQLGRPKGPGKSKLDPHRDEIIALIKNGSRKSFIAERYGCSAVNLSLWLRKHGLQGLKAMPKENH